MSGQVVGCLRLLRVQRVRRFYGRSVWSASYRRPGWRNRYRWPESAEDFEVEYVTAAGVRRRGTLGELWPVRFESVQPERRFPAFRDQGNWCGWYWSATCGDHVGFESWLERDRLVLLDFDPLVTGMASQPFRLSWTGPEGKRIRHTPDFFVRRSDGTGLVVDVRPDDRIESRDAVKFAATAAACSLVGWDFMRVGAPDAVLMANARWLAATGIRGCTARTSPPV
ncbi:TnsA-like heteromeric transposase endonuclease subunit [Streptomyces hawaiiensis]|uniref:TnsA-like heteromeric transposase endonuclease subunit n=1 Tax=Streptomyces hawaiiensis TaxID=67305 RepID=UPI00364EB58D